MAALVAAALAFPKLLNVPPYDELVRFSDVSADLQAKVNWMFCVFFVAQKKQTL
jgi:hypothetical protein